MGYVPLRSFVLLGFLAVLLASVLVVGCWPRDFLSRALGIMGFAGHFLGFIEDTMV